MTPRQIELVENSWDYVLMNTAEAGIIFYNKLFELDPSLRAMFKEDIKSQSQKLVSLITFAVHKLNTLDEIISDVKALGARHKGYKVKPAHYTTVAEALLWTLGQGLGEQWTEEVKEAWVSLYTVLSKTMIEAAEEKVVA
ncbi:hemoglobin [Cytophagales bacterium WSM2-2]|nr:hemoglobin [Cytophagales bacterium WSM2-2]